MKKIKRFYDLGICIACIIGYLSEFCFPHKLVTVLFGFAGFIYCICYIYICFCRPIERDWILVKGHFMLKIMNFVLFMPFVITATMYIADVACKGKPFSPKNLVYEDNLYSNKEYYKDTIHINAGYKVNSLFNIGDSIVAKSETALDELNVIIDSKLPHKISESQKDPSLFWSIYYHYIDPGNQHMTTSETGRRIAALISILGFFLLNGLLISTITSWFDRRREQWHSGGIRYKPSDFGKKNIAVVIGANDATPIIIKRLLENQGEKHVEYVILLTNENVENVREHISSYLSNCEEKKVIIYNGQLDSIEEIQKLQIERATEIYVLGESSNDDISQSYHDTQNMKCVHNIANYLTHKDAKRKIVCRVMFEYQTTYSVFQFSDLPKNIKENLVFIPFNIYENWAQRVFVKGEYTEAADKFLSEKQETVPQPEVSEEQKAADEQEKKIETRVIKYTPLDGTGISPDSKKHVHLVVVGMSKMGIAMAIQAAQVAHYPNFSTGKKDDSGKIVKEPSLIRTRITFIDINADNEMNFFMGRYQNLFALSRYRYMDASSKSYDSNTSWENPISSPESKYKMHGDNFIDIEWEFVKGNIQSPGVQKYLKDAAKDSDSSKEYGSLLTIAICHPLAHEAIASALYMPSEVYDNAMQILVYQREASDIVYNLSYKEDKEYKNKRYVKLRPFGMRYADFTMDKENYFRAMLCNYVYKLIFNNDVDNKNIPCILCSMDIAKKEELHMKSARGFWKELLIFHKWSNRYLANSFETKLRSIGAFHSDIETHYGHICQQFEKHKEAMAECEHNRWNVQQLLMGLRAYNDNDLTEYNRLKAAASTNAEAKTEFSNFKRMMKESPDKAHLNICSTSQLHILDPYAEGFDEVFNNSIPAILKCIEKFYNTKRQQCTVTDKKSEQ